MEVTQPDPDERRRFDTALRTALSALSVPLTDAQNERMYEHYRMVVEANEQFNLTRITSPEDAAIKHYADALALLRLSGIDAARPLRVLDVGTGAGYPGVPLAIMCPEWDVTAIDGTGKKARFVADCADRLGLANLSGVHARAEELSQESPGAFDAVLLRAVSDLGKGIETTARLLRPDGMIVFYKTSRLADGEMLGAQSSADRKRLKILKPVPYELAAADGPLDRCFYCFRRQG